MIRNGSPSSGVSRGEKLSARKAGARVQLVEEMVSAPAKHLLGRRHGPQQTRYAPPSGNAAARRRSRWFLNGPIARMGIFALAALPVICAVITLKPFPTPPRSGESAACNPFCFQRNRVFGQYAIGLSSFRSAVVSFSGKPVFRSQSGCGVAEPGHGMLRNFKAELQQFAMDSGRSPDWILPCHALTELAKFRSELGACLRFAEKQRSV